MTEAEAFASRSTVRDARTGIWFVSQKYGPVYHPSRYLRGWVTEGGVRRYVLAPLPGSHAWGELTNTTLEMR